MTKIYEDIEDWYLVMRDRNVQDKDFLIDDCAGLNDMMNPNLVYAVVGMFLKGTWNITTGEGYNYHGGKGNGMNGFSKTKGKRKMKRYKF